MPRKILFLSVFIAILLSVSIYIKPEKRHLSQISSALPNQETAFLPDLAPFAMYDLRLATINGRTVLKFSSSFVNKGKGNLELIGDPNIRGDGFRDVYQRITNKNGTLESKVVGYFEWHVAHNHYHYSDFAEYIFGPVSLALANVKAPLATRQKTTFCLRDNELAMPNLEGAPATKGFTYCTQDRQGVSVGWTDIYNSTLPDQYIDVEDMPAGIYQLSFFVDPNQRFIEEDKENNISTVFFELDQAKNFLRPIASATPFYTSHNNFPNDFLVYVGGDTKVYVLHNNKKRWLKTAEIFNSYNYPWDQIHGLTQSMVNAIPNNNLIRLIGAEEVYAINDAGYKRHIPNPEVFFSYGFTEADVAAINQTELNIYPNSYLIMTPGNNDVYTISTHTKRKLGTLESLQLSEQDLSSIHIINQTDFDSYITW